jgi:hypothetical protein
MRGVVISALALLLPTLAIAQEPSASHATQPRSALPSPTAEPENAEGYAPPAPRERIGPTEEDFGPERQHFVIANQTDNLEALADPPRLGNLPKEKIAFDPRIKIALIHDVENDSNYKGGENHALLFEIKYINWGAVTQEQIDARHGHYFTISWANHGPPEDLVARFQYRQVKSQAIVRTLDQPMSHVHGTVRSYFAVVSRAYLAYGPVSAWRLTIRRGDTVVGEAKSYLW